MKAHGNPDQQLAARDSIARTVRRIELLVDQETEALRTRAAIDLKDSNNKKSQALLELNLATRAIQGAPLDPELVHGLKTLRSKLELNRIILRRHLEAVREVASVVTETIQDRDWDGTYSQQGSGVGR